MVLLKQADGQQGGRNNERDPVFYCARVADGSRKVTGLTTFDGYRHAGKHRWRWLTVAAVMAAAALAVVPALAPAQSGGGQYEPTPPKPGGGTGDPGTGGGTSGSPGGSGSGTGGGGTAAPATGDSASQAPATGGGEADATGSEGIQSGTGVNAPPTTSSSGSADQATGERDRSGPPKKLQLADVSPLAHVTDRPPAAIGAQGVSGGGLGVVPLLIGVLLMVVALAIILRGLVRARGAAS